MSVEKTEAGSRKPVAGKACELIARARLISKLHELASEVMRNVATLLGSPATGYRLPITVLARQPVPVIAQTRRPRQ